DFGPDATKIGPEEVEQCSLFDAMPLGCKVPRRIAWSRRNACKQSIESRLGIGLGMDRGVGRPVDHARQAGRISWIDTELDGPVERLLIGRIWSLRIGKVVPSPLSDELIHRRPASP